MNIITHNKVDEGLWEIKLERVTTTSALIFFVQAFFVYFCLSPFFVAQQISNIIDDQHKR